MSFQLENICFRLFFLSYLFCWLFAQNVVVSGVFLTEEMQRTSSYETAWEGKEG